MNKENNTVYFDGLEPGQTKTQDNGITVERSECGNKYTWNLCGTLTQLDLSSFFENLKQSPSYQEIFERKLG